VCQYKKYCKPSGEQIYLEIKMFHKPSGTTGTFRVFFSLSAMILAAVVAFSGCQLQFGEKIFTSFKDMSIPAGFDFSATREITFNLDVSYRGDSGIKLYTGTVSIVTQDDTGDSVLGSGLIVNGNGSFKVVVPTTVSRVEIRPDEMILVGAEAMINASTKVITAVLAPPADKAIASSAKGILSRDSSEAIDFGKTKSGFMTLSKKYDSNGVPTEDAESGGLEDHRVYYAESFTKNVGLSFPESQRIPVTRPEYIANGILSNVIVKEDAAVAITFLSEGAGYKNSLGYFVTKTGDPLVAPKIGDIVIIFPNSSAAYSGGGLYAGDTIKLRNPLEGENKGTYKFLAGTTIHWVLVQSGFVSGDVSNTAIRYYSDPELNPEYKGPGTNKDSAHSALLFYTDDPYDDFSSSTERTDDDSKLVLGIEDMARAGSKNAGDEDFNDCLFVVGATPFKNIDTSSLPKPTITPPSDVIESFPAKTVGTMIYEDQWPSKGDYDFNDLKTEFRFHTTRTASGYAKTYRAEFTLTAAGANHKSSLGFVLPVDPANIASVTYSGKAYNGSVFSLNAKKFETHTGYSVIPVFGSATEQFGAGQTIVNTKMDKPTLASIAVQIDITFVDGKVLSSSITGTTPDMFLVASEDRSKEVHVIGKAPTSSAAGSGFFNSFDDKSEPPLYYKDKAGAPWALMILAPMSHMIEQAELPSGYLHFGNWVMSSGAQYADWYDSSKSGYAAADRLYVPH
jgi:LruC domain-containing protein